MGSQSFDQTKSTEVDQDYDHVNRQTMPVINQGINYRFIRRSNKMCSLSNIFLSALVLLSMMSFSPVTSSPLIREVRSAVSLAREVQQLQIKARETKDTLYDCHIASSRTCVLQSFRVKRFADETAEPANVNIPNLPTAMNNTEILDLLTLSELVPKLHRELVIYAQAFHFMKEDERHPNLPEGTHFIEEFSDVYRKITDMLPHIQYYMNHHEYAALTNDLIPGFDPTEDPLFFSPRSLHVLNKFKPFLTQLLLAISDRF